MVMLLQQFLQVTLFIAEQVFFPDIAQHMPSYDFSGFLKASVTENRSDDGFHRISRDGILGPAAHLFLPVSESQELRNPHARGAFCQGRLADQACPGFGKLSLTHFRMAMEQILRTDKLQYGITQKLQALIVLTVFLPVLVGIGCVSHGRQKQFPVLKMVTNPVLELF